MKYAYAFLGAALFAGAGSALIFAPSERALAAPGAFAAADESAKPVTCLQNDLIYNFNVVSTRLVQVMDRNNHAFTVQLTGGCVGLNNLATLSFRTQTNLGCLQKGDRLSFREPTLGVMSCIVTDVQPVAPKAPG